LDADYEMYGIFNAGSDGEIPQLVT